jgi:hypothetical protein
VGRAAYHLHVVPSVELGAALPHEDEARVHALAAELLHAQPLALAVSATPRDLSVTQRALSVTPRDLNFFYSGQ